MLLSTPTRSSAQQVEDAAFRSYETARTNESKQEGTNVHLQGYLAYPGVTAFVYQHIYRYIAWHLVCTQRDVTTVVDLTQILQCIPSVFL